MTRPIAPAGMPPRVVSLEKPLGHIGSFENHLNGELQQTQQNAKLLATAPPPAKRMPIVDRSQVDPKLVKAAEGLESMFIELMFKEMRKTVQKSDMDMENHATQIYRGMLDHEMADTAARTGGVGLADQIIAYLQSTGYTGNRR
jgi:hypothetical protein